MNSKLTNILKTTLVLGAMFGFVAFASAGTWTAPAATPPGANVDAPINVGATGQEKIGGLMLGGPATALIGAQLQVVGVTGTQGFANFGTSFLQGNVAIGANWPSGGTTPLVYVAPPSSLTTGASAVFGGPVGVRGSLGVVQADGSIVPTTTTSGYNTIYVQSIPVCLKNGSNCPAASTGTSGLTSVAHDTTLTGDGTATNPLSVVSTGASCLTGTGITNYVPKFISSSSPAVEDSNIVSTSAGVSITGSLGVTGPVNVGALVDDNAIPIYTIPGGCGGDNATLYISAPPSSAGEWSCKHLAGYIDNPSS